jgi:hypothetical protein
MKCNNTNYKEGYKPLGNNMDGPQSHGGNKIHNITKLATQPALIETRVVQKVSQDIFCPSQTTNRLILC